MKSQIHPTDYAGLLNALWRSMVEKEYSFVVKDVDGRIIGVALNFDAHDEPDVQLVGGLETIFIFLDHLEVPIKYD